MTWLIKKLGEVCEIVGGGTPSTSILNYWGSDFCWITPKDLGQLKNIEISQTFKKISKLGLKNSSAKLLPSGSVILSSRAPIGYVAINSIEMATNQGCRSFVCGGKINNRYLYYFLKNSTKLLYSFAGGSTFAEISGSKLKEIEIPLPPLAIQKKVVKKIEELFKKIDEAKRMREEAQKDSAALIPAVLHKIFEEGKKKGWEVKNLGDLFDITSSKRVFKSEWKNSGIPFYRAREIVCLAKNKAFRSPIFISEEMYEKYKSKYGAPQEDDILATGVGTLGICYRVKSGDRFYFKDGNIIWLKKISNIESKFIEYFFKSAMLKDQIEQNAGGATVRTFTIKTAKAVSIPLPPLSEQKKIVAYLDSLSEKVKELQKAQAETAADFGALRQSILHAAFEGKLVK